MDRVLTYGLIGLAGVAAMEQQAVRAARLLGAAEANAAYGETITAPSHGANRLYFAAYTAAARAELDEQAFGVAWAEGRAMTLEQAIAYALAEDPMPAEPRACRRPVAQSDRASRTDVTARAAVRASLTRREREVLWLVAQGHSNRAIAQALAIEEGTVSGNSTAC